MIGNGHAVGSPLLQFGLALPSLVLIFVLMRLIKPIIALVIGTLLLFLFSHFLLGINVLPHYLIAWLILFPWYFLLRNLYRYNREDVRVFGIPLFPVLAWSVGLPSGMIVLRLFFATIHKTPPLHFPVWYGAFIVILVIYEWVGYHLLNIRLRTEYKGFPLIDCMHVPGWVKAGYFSIGVLYYYALDGFDLLLF